MGRIKGTHIKRATKAILSKHKGEFTADFTKNKEILNKIQPIQKKFRNSIAGYLSRIVKKQQEEEKKKRKKKAAVQGDNNQEI